MTRRTPLIVLAALLAAPLAPAAAEPTSRPDRPARPGSGNVPRLRALMRAVGELDLPADRRAEVDVVIDRMRDDLRSIVEGGGDPRTEGREVMQRVRRELRGLLSDEERMQLAKAVREANGGRGDRPGRRPGGRAMDGGMNARGQLRLDVPDGGGFAQDGDRPLTPAGSPALFEPDAPADAAAVPVVTLDGQATTLAELRRDVRRPTVVVAGSLSSPTFRAHAAGLDALRAELGNDVNWVWLYAGEAHPAHAEPVKRNQDEGIAVDEPATLVDRIALARRTRDAGDLGGVVAVDDLNEAALGGLGITATGVAVLDVDMSVRFRDRHADVTAIRNGLDRLGDDD